MNFDAVPMGPGNPHGNAIRISETVLETELQAQRDIDLRAQRYWKIVNPSVTTRWGSPRATSWCRG